MISYKHHLQHMRYAASRIDNPQGYLYNQIKKFIGYIKKTKYTFRPSWGRVFTFIYAAKFAKTLPYYDRYPMVLVLKRYSKKGYFDGFNLHYISPYYRKIFLRGIAHIHMRGVDRYHMSEFYEATSRLIRRIAKPLIHRYRIDHVRGMRYIRIPGVLPEYFGSVNDQTFMKTGLQRVWMESMRAIFRGAHRKFRAEVRKKARKAAKRHEEAHKKAKRSSTPLKPKHGKAAKKSMSAKNSKASTGKRYGGKRK